MNDFDRWFAALNDGCSPFTWQRRLFREVMQGKWPTLIQLPTASGKTALIDIAVLALGAGAPQTCRRIAFVVDRRVVVDEAAMRADKIAAILSEALSRHEDCLHPIARKLVELGGAAEEPLIVATLRGGIQADDSWARSPAQPAVILSTVDQVGSRLLFRAYGDCRPRSLPIHAGLLGTDCLLIVDEAHCSLPFCETVRLISEKYQTWAERTLGFPLRLVRMTATPDETPDFFLENSDLSGPVDAELKRRIDAKKPTELVLVKSKGESHRVALVEEILTQTRKMMDKPRVIGIVLNRVADARAVFEKMDLPYEAKLLLTGRVRGWERDRLLERWKPLLRAGERKDSDQTLVVVATQCIEVGANFDFDALVTEVAPLDALRQRFGRLNRLGRRADAMAKIIATERQVEIDDKGRTKELDFVYGEALAQTWKWLCDNAHMEKEEIDKKEKERRLFDFGISALDSLIPTDKDLVQLCTPCKHAPPLLPAHVDLFVQTSPLPEPSPDVAIFLHGLASGPADVSVVWRADLTADHENNWTEIVALQPPKPGEGCSVPFPVVRDWLAWSSSSSDFGGDIEGHDDNQNGLNRPMNNRQVLRWRGAEDSIVIGPQELRPGDTIVVPAAYGGCDAYGWNPNITIPVKDIGDAVAHSAGRRPVLRLSEPVLKGWFENEEIPGAFSTLRKQIMDIVTEDRESNPMDTLNSLLDEPALSGDCLWMKELITKIQADRRLRKIVIGDETILIGTGNIGREVSTASEDSAFTTTTLLSEHLQGVQDWISRFVDAIGLPNALREDLSLAAWLHDVGKADPRFQIWLHGGDEVAAAIASELLAKSPREPRNAAANARARKRADYPPNCRHEVMSVALVQDIPELQAKAHDWDLVLYLLSSHHGYCRPLAPAYFEDTPVDVNLILTNIRLSGTSAHELHQVDKGVPDRFWHLVHRYGWWGLAWLEACLRLADHRSSEAERFCGGNAND